MPHARVGAMPQPSPENEQEQYQPSGRARGGRKQGITMQDLKKQTAMRLAQEQQHRRNFGEPDPKEETPSVENLDQKRSGQPNYQSAALGKPSNAGQTNFYRALGHQTDFYQQGASAYPLQESQPYRKAFNVFEHSDPDNSQDTLHPWQPSRDAEEGALRLSNYSNEQGASALPSLSVSPLSSTSRFYSETAPMAGDAAFQLQENVSPSRAVKFGSGHVSGSVSPSPAKGPFHHFGTPATRGMDTQPQMPTQMQMGHKINPQKPTRKKQQRQPPAPPPGISAVHQSDYQHLQSSAFDVGASSPMPPTYSPREHQQRGWKQFHRNAPPGNSHMFHEAVASQQHNPPSSDHGRHGGGKQSKLPHGLTVHELKEMTKARLQAEAAERQEQEHQHQTLIMPHQRFQQHQSPKHPTNGPSSGSAREPHSESTLRQPYLQHRQNSMDSTASAPPAVVQPQPQTGSALYRTHSHQSLGEQLASHFPSQTSVQNFSVSNRSRAVSCDNNIGLGQQQSNNSQGIFFQSANNRQQQQLGKHDSLETTSVTSMNRGRAVSCDNVGVNQQQGSQSIFFQNANSRQQQHQAGKHADALETASVTSMNSTLGSDYLGSESAYSFGLGGMQQQSQSSIAPDENGSMTFGRSRSYPAGASIGAAIEQHPYEITPTSTVTTSSSFFETSVGGGQNRRRTSTLSPPGLSHLHEDRPLMGASAGGEDLSIPTFDAPSRNNLTARVNNVEFSSSPSASRGSSPAFPRIGQLGGVIGGGVHDIFNPRPSSVASVPTVAPSGESMDANDHDVVLPLTFGSENRAFSLGGLSLNGELPNSVAESVLVTPQVGDGRKVLMVDGKDERHVGLGAGVSAVFRNNSRLVESETDLRVPAGEMTLTSTSSGGFLFPEAAAIGASDTRVETSWGSSPGALSSGRPLGGGGGASLADDLSTILSLSGGGETSPDDPKGVKDMVTENHVTEGHGHRRVPSLVSRIDPEVKVDVCPLPNQNPLMSSFDPVVPDEMSSPNASPFLNRAVDANASNSAASQLCESVVASTKLSDVSESSLPNDASSRNGSPSASSSSSSTPKPNTSRRQKKKGAGKGRRKRGGAQGATGKN